MIEAAADRAGTDAGSLVEALAGDAARFRLLADALAAAERAVLDEKVAALASSLAGAALSQELGPGTGTDPMTTLNWHQLEGGSRLVGALVRHGLIATLGGGAMFGGGSGTPSYRITDFGGLILERMGRRS